MTYSNMILTLQRWLEEKIGLNPELISSQECEAKILERMKKNGIDDPDKYFQRLRGSLEEQKAVIESVVVPETWFFREKGSLDFLVNYLQQQWVVANQGKEIQILSVACSSGEEPYSIAMALFENGFNSKKFRIDAIDISTPALEKAKLGIYGSNSFRSKDLKFRDFFFEPLEGGLYRIKDAVKKQVTFHNNNIVDPEFLLWPHSYDVIFCRNVLIYLSRVAYEKLFNAFDKILLKNGVVIVGHAEGELLRNAGYVSVKFPKSFAFRKAEPIKGAELLPKVLSAPSGKEKKSTIKPEHLEKSNKLKPKLKIKNKVDIEPITPKELSVEDLLSQALEFANQGLLEQAEELCKKTIKSMPANIKANFLLGTLYHTSLENEKAEIYFQKVIYLDPYHEEALVYLSLLAEKKGDLQKADLLNRRLLKVLAMKETHGR